MLCKLRKKTLGTLHAGSHFYNHGINRKHRADIGPNTKPHISTSGIGVALHFVRNDVDPPKGDQCCCDKFRFIQVITTNSTKDERATSYVDNKIADTPFYGEVFTGRSGRHGIPEFYPGGPDPNGRGGM